MEIASRKQQESPCDLILRMWDEEMNRDDAATNISEAPEISYKY